MGDTTRETEQPIAIFEYKEHAEEFCKKMWSGIGEVRDVRSNLSETSKRIMERHYQTYEKLNDQ